MFHPATLLLFWAGAAAVLPWLSPDVLFLLLVPALIVAMLFAQARTMALLRRARWLLLSIALLFAFATPGLSAPGVFGQIGATLDGLSLAAEHVLRLLVLLVTLALLHERLGTAGLVTGLYWLLGPFYRWRGLREKIVVRLMLVLEFVEAGNAHWQDWLGDADTGPTSMALAVRRARLVDWLALAVIVCGMGVLAW